MKISPKCQTWVNGNDFHIGVGSDVVCSTIIGNARASTRGMDNRTIPRFFVSNSC